MVDKYKYLSLQPCRGATVCMSGWRVGNHHKIKEIFYGMALLTVLSPDTKYQDSGKGLDNCVPFG